MGWSTGFFEFDKKGFVEYLTRSWGGDKHTYKTLHKKVIGNKIWSIVEHTDLEKNEVETFIVLNLISKTRSEGWGYKSMSEYAGPAYYDCPLKFLELSPCPEDEYAKEWRLKVIESQSTPKLSIEVGKKYKLQEWMTLYGFNNLTCEVIDTYTRVYYVARLFNSEGRCICNRMKVKKSHVLCEI